jgi:hypothetical protein
MVEFALLPFKLPPVKSEENPLFVLGDGAIPPRPPQTLENKIQIGIQPSYNIPTVTKPLLMTSVLDHQKLYGKPKTKPKKTKKPKSHR